MAVKSLTVKMIDEGMTKLVESMERNVVRQMTGMNGITVVFEPPQAPSFSTQTVEMEPVLQK